jgi:hypothetical protein
MVESKRIESDGDLVLRDEREKDAAEGGMGDLTLGGHREKMLVRKLDLHLVPLIMLLYTFSFLDRYVALPLQLLGFYDMSHEISFPNTHS